jgi:MFS transporter, FSR family, fosmidomycin resistance protein
MQEHTSNSRRRSLFSFCAFHFVDDGISDALYILLPFIAIEMHLTLSEVGLIKGAFSASMSFFQLPVALLGEKVGEFTLIALGTISLSAGFLAMSLAYTLPAVLLALVTGKALCAGQHSLSSSMLSRTFEDSGRRAAMGTYNFSGDLGKVCLPLLIAIMINFWGWREATFFFSVGTIILSIILWLFSRKTLIRPVHIKRASGGKGWGITSPLGFSSLLTIGFMDYSVRAGFLTFLPFLLIEKGVPVPEIGLALTLLFAGGAAGKFACGLLAEWFGINAMIVSTEAITAACILGAYYLPTSYIWAILPFLGIALNGTSSVLYASVAELISPDKRSRGYGLYYAVTLGAGLVSPVIFGLIGEAWSLQYTFIFIAVLALLTLPFILGLKQRPCG